MAAPSIPVVICAYAEKRWHETCAAVESVRAQSLPSEEIIIVVDHNPALLSSLAAALPDVTVVENREVRGLSGGKNTGAALAATFGPLMRFVCGSSFAAPRVSASVNPDPDRTLTSSHADRPDGARNR